MAVLHNLRKCSCMSLDWLADTTIPAIQLHGTLNLEGRRVGRVARNSNEDEPFLVRRHSVIDDLGSGKGSMAFEDFLWWRCLVRDGPMKDRSVSDHPDCCIGNPFPEDDILIVDV